MSNNCHLSGRVPHQLFWDAWKESRFKERNSRDELKELERMNKVSTDVVNGWNQEEELSGPEKELLSKNKTFRKARHIARAFASIVDEFSQTMKCDSCTKRLSECELTPEEQHRAFNTIDEPDDVPIAKICVMLLHGCYKELKGMIDKGFDLATCKSWMGSGNLDYGFVHILEHYPRYYFYLNQLLLHGWPIEDILKGAPYGMDVNPSTMDVYNPKYREYAMRKRIHWVLKEYGGVTDHHLMSHCRKSWRMFCEKIQSGALSAAHVRDFCKDVLFPPLYGIAHMVRYNEIAHRRVLMHGAHNNALWDVGGETESMLYTELSNNDPWW
jgi:hypothetical protein